jgi:hypothetical protein
MVAAGNRHISDPGLFSKDFPSRELARFQQALDKARIIANEGLCLFHTDRAHASTAHV